MNKYKQNHPKLVQAQFPAELLKWGMGHSQKNVVIYICIETGNFKVYRANIGFKMAERVLGAEGRM